MSDHAIELAEHESVTDRGTRRVFWRVKRGDGWVASSDWPGAVRTAVDPRPGTVWEYRIELELPTGTLLERIESAPKEPTRRDALDYLSEERVRAQRSVRRSRFRVGARGTVDRI